VKHKPARLRIPFCAGLVNALNPNALMWKVDSGRFFEKELSSKINVKLTPVLQS